MKVHYFKIANNFVDRSLAKQYGLKENQNQEWYVVEHQRTTSEFRHNLKAAERTFAKTKITEGTEFAGEKAGQKPGDQVRSTERAKKSKKQHPFKGRLVGGV